MSLLPWAVRALQRRLWVFPCNRVGTRCPETGQNVEKMGHLIRPDRPWKIRWSEAATNDLDQVISYWTQDPQSNIAIPCKQSRLLVVDCDKPKRENALVGTPWAHLHDAYGPLPTGEDVLNEMCYRYEGDWAELCDTYTVRTGSGGKHLYFTWPPGIKTSQASPVPEFVDVRGNGGEKGGYVLAAGSVTSKGTYTEENSLPIAPCPRWLVELVREKPRPVRPIDPYQQPGRGGGGGGGGDIFRGLVGQVMGAPEGNRNSILLWASRCACSDGATLVEAEKALVAAAVQSGLNEREARATVRSGYRLQRMKG